MSSSIEVLLTIDDQGFATKLYCERSRKTYFDGQYSDTFRASIRTADELLRSLLSAFGMTSKGFRLRLDQTDYVKAQNTESPVDGRSAGAAIFVLMFSEAFGLPLRSSACVTGCLEAHGDVTYVQSLDKKLFDAYGACKQEHIDFIILPPPPRTETGFGDDSRRDYDMLLRNIESEYPDKNSCVVSHLTQLFSVDTFTSLFEEQGILNFVKSSGYLLSPQSIPSEDENELVGAFVRLLDWYVDNYWARTDEVIREGSQQYDLRAVQGFNRARDFLLELFESGNSSHVREFLRILMFRYSGELVMANLGDDILHEYRLRFVEQSARVHGACDLAFCEELQHQGITSKDQESYLRLAMTHFRTYIMHLQACVDLLEMFCEINVLLGIRAFKSTAMFNEFEQKCHELQRKIQSRRISASDYLYVLLHQGLVVRFSGMEKAFFQGLEVTEDAKGAVVYKLKLPPSCMDVRVTEDLSELEFVIDESETKRLFHPNELSELKEAFPVKGGNRIKDPVLLWQESSGRALPRYYQPIDFDHANCAILRLPDGHMDIRKDGRNIRTEGLIQHLFSSKPMTISCESQTGTTSVHWACYYRWPPSIDSLWFASVLRTRVFKRLRSAADVGCGTGFLGIDLAKRFERLKTLVFSDVNHSVVLLAEQNAQENLAGQITTGLLCKTVTGAGLMPLSSLVGELGILDVIVSAPPYLPRVKEYALHDRLMTAVNGTELLEELVTEGAKYCKELLVQFSQIARPEFESACNKVGLHPGKPLATKTVPVRIQPILPYHPKDDLRLDLDNPRQAHEYEGRLEEYEKLIRYHEFLLKENRIRDLDKGNYRFWHDIYVYSIRF